MKLTQKQEKFCLVFVDTGNATEAYKSSYDTSGMKPATINRKAKELMDNGKIAARIAELRAPILKKLEVSAEKTLREIATVAFSNVKNVFDENGRLIPVHLMQEEVTASISSIKFSTKTVPGSSPAEVEHITEMKFWDKPACLEKLGKHLKLFNEVGSKENPLTLSTMPDSVLEAIACGAALKK